MRDDDRAESTLTDEDAAFLRYARFSELPDRIPPDKRVELTENESPRYWPEPALDPEVSSFRMGGSA